MRRTVGRGGGGRGDRETGGGQVEGDRWVVQVGGQSPPLPPPHSLTINCTTSSAECSPDLTFVLLVTTRMW